METEKNINEKWDNIKKLLKRQYSNKRNKSRKPGGLGAQINTKQNLKHKFSQIGKKLINYVKNKKN